MASRYRWIVRERQRRQEYEAHKFNQERGYPTGSYHSQNIAEIKQLVKPALPADQENRRVDEQNLPLFNEREVVLESSQLAIWIDPYRRCAHLLQFLLFVQCVNGCLIAAS